MAAGDPGKSSTSRRRVWIAALGISVATLLVTVGGAFRWANQPPPPRRFVSRPLPDGSRYTFLYPAHLSIVGEKGPVPGSVAGVSIFSATPVNASPSPLDRLRRWMGQKVPYPGESITVFVTRPGAPIRKDSRKQERWARGIEVRHNETIRDTRTQLQFLIYFSNFTLGVSPQAAAAQVDAHSRVLSESFQVLPPGASPAPR